MTALIVIVAVLVALDLLGWRFGVDTRRSREWTLPERDGGSPAMSPSGRHHG